MYSVAQLAEHWASIPKVVGSNPTVARHIFQACPVWIYTQSSNYIQFRVVLQNTRIQTRGPNAGGGECFHDTTFRTQNPSIFSFFILFINQPNLCSSRLATSRSRGERAKLCGARSTCFACKNILLIKILARKLI